MSDGVDPAARDLREATFERIAAHHAERLQRLATSYRERGGAAAEVLGDLDRLLPNVEFARRWCLDRAAERPEALAGAAEVDGRRSLRRALPAAFSLLAAVMNSRPLSVKAPPSRCSTTTRTT